eukprot:GEMP01032906.1.p1 GENE.GEMP01032906.1~~GEMP01032906.1.p1  ORF type:complete len:219 (+),score=28.54 GEMP01032906.1:109-765(+)
MVIPLPEVPSQLPGPTPPEVLRNLKHIRVAVWGIIVCSLGRYFTLDEIGALNDGFSFVFGICLLGDNAFFGCKISCCRMNEWGAFSCLLPFCMVSGVNAVFDGMLLPRLSNTCQLFSASAHKDTFQMAMCSHFLFIFAATILQALGCYLSWRSYKLIRPLIHRNLHPMPAGLPFHGWRNHDATSYAEVPERDGGLENPLSAGEREFIPFSGHAHYLGD